MTRALFSKPGSPFLFAPKLVAMIAFILAPACSEGGDSSATAPAQDALTGDGPDFSVSLKPVLGGDNEVSAIDVHSVIRGGLEDPSQPFSIAAPVVYANVFGVADRIENLTLTDAVGGIPFTVEEDPPVPGGFPYFRHWRATRDVTFPVTISYRSLVQPASGPPGPAFGIRPSAGGVSGAGAGFLALPENTTADHTSVTWDLSAFGESAAAITTFGEGGFNVAGPPAAIMQGWYMAGPLERFPGQGDQNGFSAAWLGDFPFDEDAEMAFVADAYTYLADFFEYLEPAPRYRVFMRLMKTPPYGGGTALGNSFMLSRGPANPEEAGGEGPRKVFFHEMIHQWVGGIDAPHGVSSWFSEGLTTYYTHVLPMRGGFSTVDDFVKGVNALSKSYYSNPAREMSAAEITEVGFGDGDIRHIPYQRGALYFADLDAKIRAASGGKRTLDIFMREIFEQRENDPEFEFNHEKWIELTTEEIGPSAGDQFRSVILAGALIIPDASAFGPCLRPRPVTYETEDAALSGVEWTRVEGTPDDVCGNYKKDNVLNGGSR